MTGQSESGHGERRQGECVWFPVHGSMKNEIELEQTESSTVLMSDTHTHGMDRLSQPQCVYLKKNSPFFDCNLSMFISEI